MKQRKKRRFTLLFVPLLLCFSFSLLSCGKKPTGKIVGREVRVSYDFDNFPFTKEDEEGSATGFEVELIEAIAKREGFSVRFLPKNQSTLEPSVIAGTSDMAIGGLVEEKTEKRVDFSKSYQEMQLAFLLSRKNSGLFTEAAQDGAKEDRILEALRGKRIYVKEGSFAAAFLEERRENYGYFLTVVQTNEDFREALEGDADAICDFSSFLFRRKRNFLSLWGMGRIRRFSVPLHADSGRCGRTVLLKAFAKNIKAIFRMKKNRKCFFMEEGAYALSFF